MGASIKPVAIISGSASGIGAATALHLAGTGCDVVVNYAHNAAGAERAAEACRERGAKALVAKGDVAQDEDCRSIVDATLGAFGHIDILVNNAGTTHFANAEDLDALGAADFARIFSVNVTGSFLLTRAAVPTLRQSAIASIVNVSSHSGFSGIGSSLAYAASKGALNTLTLGLARALAPKIRVNAVCPGFVDTKWMAPKLGEEALADFRDGVAAIAPLKQIVSAEDVAEAIGWFALGGRRTTGQLLVIDAGTHLTLGNPINAQAH